MPQSGGCIRASVRSSVDLPMPLGPSRHTSSPACTARLTRSSTARRVRRRPIADGQVARAQRGCRSAGGRRVASPSCGNAPRRLRSSTATTTGAPMSDVTAFSGSTPALPGKSDTICATSATVPPISTTAGTSTRWSDVPSRPRHRCGTAMPRNEIGPQNAVTTAPSTDAPSIVSSRARRTASAHRPRVVLAEQQRVELLRRRRGDEHAGKRQRREEPQPLPGHAGERSESPLRPLLQPFGLAGADEHGDDRRHGVAEHQPEDQHGRRIGDPRLDTSSTRPRTSGGADDGRGR